MKTYDKRLVKIEQRLDHIEQRLDHIEQVQKQLTCKHVDTEFEMTIRGDSYEYRERCKYCKKVMRKFDTKREYLIAMLAKQQADCAKEGAYIKEQIDDLPQHLIRKDMT